MLATVRALLEHLIDYAGMFPPARLPLREALRHYTRVAATPEAWMLGRFVCQAANLGELRAACTDGGPPSLAVAARRGGRDMSEFRQNLDADLDDIEGYRKQIGPRGRVDALELTLPGSLHDEEISRLADEVLPSFHLPAFLEVAHGPSWQRDMQALTDALRRRVPQSTIALTVGLKVRCGGATIPSAAQLAFFIARCCEARLPWKATAGLHHPLRHRDPESGVLMHGFLNVFAAGIFAHVHALEEAPITAMLEEEAIDAFQFTEDGVRWRDWECTAEQIRAARRWVPSFGSCSFDEPRDNLRRLCLIP